LKNNESSGRSIRPARGVASLTADVTFLLPFAAGNFIYIAAADLIPEIKHEENARLNVLHFLSFIAGISLLLAVRFAFGH
jgi:zinc and cadmium transporter